MSSSRLVAPGQPHLAYLVHGDDAGLVGQELHVLLDELAALEGTGVAAIEEYGEVRGREDESVLAPVLDACRTPPFFAERRLVVVRDATVFDAAMVRELAAYLAAPLPTTVLVLGYAGRSTPAALTKAFGGAGLVINAAPSSGGRGRNAWFAEHLRRSPMRLDREATTLLESHLGEDLARLEGVLTTLEAGFGPGATIGTDELEPYLGEAGGVAPFELNDAIDVGDLNRAIVTLRRMTGGGRRHPLEILASLHRHFSALLVLDGADVAGEAAAAELTGLHPFPAKKALAQARRLGHEPVARAIELLAAADLDLRGRSGLPEDAVLEILVARLAQLSRTAARR